MMKNEDREPVPGSPKINIWIVEQRHTRSIKRGSATLRTYEDKYIVTGGTVKPIAGVPNIKNPPEEFEDADGHVSYRTDDIDDAVESLVRISERIREEQFDD